VNVMAKMLRYASFFFATRIINILFYKHSLEPADASYIAKDGLTIPDFQKERVETGFTLCSKLVKIFLFDFL
jgi:hypothetical protein